MNIAEMLEAGTRFTRNGVEYVTLRTVGFGYVLVVRAGDQEPAPVFAVEAPKFNETVKR